MMVTAADLHLVLLAGAPAIPLTGVSVIEHIAGVEAVERGGVAVMARAIDLAGYRLDSAARILGERGAAALVLIDPPPLSATVRAIAERAGLAVLAADRDTDLGRLCTDISRVIDGGAADALVNAVAFVSALRSSGAPSPERAEELAETAFGPIAPNEGAAGMAHRLAQIAAGEITARWLEGERTRADAPIRSRGVVLTELLLAAPHRTTLVADRARSLGLPVDGWHTVVRLELEASDEHVRTALETARAAGGVWHAALLGSAIVLVRMDRAEPTQRQTSAVAVAATRVLESLAGAGPVRCGVGTPHAGLAGLRSSDAEARSALRLRPAGRGQRLRPGRAPAAAGGVVCQRRGSGLGGRAAGAARRAR